SLGNIAAELAALYGAEAGGEPPATEPLDYLQFSEWQNELFEEESDESRTLRELRQSSLSVAPFAFEPAADKRGPFRPAAITIAIDDGRTARLDEMAQRANTNISDVLLTCWQVLIRRLTGLPDFVLSAACSGRKYGEMEG